jgi:hypothetical protein
VYRCKRCQGIYNLYSGTVFEGRYFRPEQVVLFLPGVCQGKATAQLARELRISRTTATEVRQLLQANAERSQPQTKLEDNEVETDEMFQNAGKKVSDILTPKIHLTDEPISDGGEALMQMTVLPFVLSLDEPRNRLVFVS